MFYEICPSPEGLGYTRLTASCSQFIEMETKDKARLLAELTKILVPEEKPQKEETNAVLSNILLRLEQIENELSAKKSVIAANALPPLHPSQEKFNIIEAADVLLSGTNEKACRFEPDKPCDYCSMCSARGY